MKIGRGTDMGNRGGEVLSPHISKGCWGIPTFAGAVESDLASLE